MIRKMLTATTVVAALLLSVLSLGSLSADATISSCGYDAYISSAGCAPSVPYPGPFTNMPGDSPGTPLNPVAVAVSDLADTGSESAVLVYAGTGLIAFGAVALGSRRKFFQGTLEV
jgi:LPXTG-motif cell wall-anchored protein